MKLKYFYIILSLNLTVLYSYNISTDILQNAYRPLENSEINLHINYLPNINFQHFSWGIQWWVSPNLYISSILDPQFFEEDYSLYYNMNIGYSNPFWKWLESSANSFELGFHRYRFIDSDISRWISIAYRIRYLGEKFGLGSDIVKYYFSDDSTIKLSALLIWKPLEKLYLESGFSLNSKKSFTPIFKLSIGI